MSSIRLAKTRIFPTDRDPFAMSIKIIAMYRCSKQRRARKRIGGRKETKRLRTIGNWLQCRSHSSMHLQVPSYICAFQERKREKKKKKKKGRVFEQSNRWLFIILSRYIYIYIKLEVFHFFFFKYLFHSLFYSFVSYHLCNFYSISFFYFFFIHIPTPLVLSPRHCVHVRLQCLQSEFVLEQKLYILERGRGREERRERGRREGGVEERNSKSFVLWVDST